MTKIKEIKEIEDKIERFESLLNVELKELKEEIEAVKQKELEQEPWPKLGDLVWYLDRLGEAITGSYAMTSFWNYQLSIGNLHRTKEQALLHKEYITSPRVRARELVEMCDGFDLHGIGVIALEFDGTPMAYMYEDKQPNGGFRFTDFDIAASALISLGEPLIKVALGVIVGEEAERIVREAMGMVK